MLLVGVLFLLGLCVGSFLSVVIERLPRGEDVIRGRSRCPDCGHELAGRDLVPLLSFVVLRGRCRYCQQKISWQYPLVELATGLLFVLSTISNHRFGESPLADQLTIVSSVFLVPIFIIDLKHGIIPDKIVFPAIFTFSIIRMIEVIYRIFSLYRNLKGDVGGLGPYLLQTDFFRQHVWLELRPLLWTLLGSLVLYFIFYILHSAFRGRAMGGGDVKLAFLVGLITGWPNMIVAVYASVLTGAAVIVILMSLKKKKFGETVPFGPFLVIGTYLALLFGGSVLEWYLGFL